MTPGGRPELEVAALSGEVDAVMRGIVAHLMRFACADGASLSTIADGYADFVVCAGEDEMLSGKTLPIEQTLGNEVIVSGDLVVLRTTTGSEVTRCLTPGAGAIVLAPIEYDGRVRGILGVRSARPDAFDDAEVETIRTLTAGASIALRNAEIVQRLAESEAQYRELHAQAADATIVTDLDGRILDANEAATALLWYTVDELRGMHAAALLAPGELDRDPVRVAELKLHRELRSERPFRRKDGAEVFAEYSARVLDDGRVHTSLRDVTQRRRNEERLRSSLGQLHAIVQTQQEISALELDPDAVTATIVERTQRLTGADGASVQWFEGPYSVFHHGSGLAAAHVGLRLERGASLAGVAAVTGEAAYAPDTATDSRVDAEACRTLGARSLVCAPLYRDGTIVGVISVLAAEPGAFDELAVETTRLMAEFVSTVIQNTNELEHRRRLAEELRTQGEVVEHMQTSLWIWAPCADGEFVLEYANAASERALGLPARDLVGLPMTEVLPAASGVAKDIFRRVTETGERVDAGELEYGDARIAPSIFSVKAFPLPGKRVAITFENVTEMARARRALQESEARFRGAFRSASVGMALTTLDGSFIQVNDRLAEMLGYDVEGLMRKTVREISHPADIAADVEAVAEMRAGTRTEWEREKRYVRQDGSVVWGHASVSLVRTYDGAPAHIVSLVQDITAQKEANLLFASTFEYSVVPKVVVDDDRRLVDLNAAAVELLGVDHDTAIGNPIDGLLLDRSLLDYWPTFLETGTWESEATICRPDGVLRQVDFVATANIRPGRHVAVVRDLTRQKELEAQLRQAQKMEAVGRLAGGIAHDFNNLLTAISGYSEFLIAGQTDDRLRRHAEEIRKAAARAAALTGQLLAFSRRQVLQPRVLDLNTVVTDMDMMLRRLIGEDVELVTMLDSNLLPVRADPTQLEQVIVNIAVNARDAMPHGGSATIETANLEIDDDHFVELRMTDTGMGMTDAERQQLFDPFFTTKEGGTGLGLATVHGIIEQSGGTIEVESAPGMGSSFRILFPAVLSEVADTVTQPCPETPEGGHETILLVEDETVVRELVAEILETSGYTVLQAGDGPSAVELLRRHTGDVQLLVTDVVMPGMSGPEVAQAVTAMRPGTQVLYTSGYTDSAIGHHGVLEPGIAFLQKPFSADDLVAKVRTLLDEAAVAVD